MNAEIRKDHAATNLAMMRRAQSNADLSMRCARCPRAIDDLRRKGAPLGQCGTGALLVYPPGDEMPLLIEMVGAPAREMS